MDSSGSTSSLTQEIEGQFRVEVTYEQILTDTDLDSDVNVPTLSVSGADIEQGRVAVEALTAAEVRPVAADQLTAVNIDELPRQLVLRTTNPILLAYKYSRREPPPRLVLSVTRHGRIETQEAAIDRADYHTLVTSDGLSVTWPGSGCATAASSSCGSTSRRDQRCGRPS